MRGLLRPDGAAVELRRRPLQALCGRLDQVPLGRCGVCAARRPRFRPCCKATQLPQATLAGVQTRAPVLAPPCSDTLQRQTQRAVRCLRPRHSRGATNICHLISPPGCGESGGCAPSMTINSRVTKALLGTNSRRGPLFSVVYLRRPGVDQCGRQHPSGHHAVHTVSCGSHGLPPNATQAIAQQTLHENVQLACSCTRLKHTRAFVVRYSSPVP